MCTGEGGYPEALYPYDENIVTQVATGLFGVREDTFQRVRMIEFKYAQGAKPGLGGHLLGDKVTPTVARIRESVTGSALFSPFPFHSVYSVEDHKKHIDWMEVDPRALVSVKVSTPTDVDMVAVGSYYAGAHVVQLDGSYGGTVGAGHRQKEHRHAHRVRHSQGAPVPPDRRHPGIGHPGGLRRHPLRLRRSQGHRLGRHLLHIGTADLVALECLRCHNCESGRGCARGIATTDTELVDLMQVSYGADRINNLYYSWSWQLKEILRLLGLRSIRELVGRATPS